MKLKIALLLFTLSCITPYAALADFESGMKALLAEVRYSIR